jgi:integrase
MRTAPRTSASTSGRAGITRAALYANDARSKRIWFHDLRATSLTWRAIRGDEAAVIQAVARHTSFATTLGYINGATLLRKEVAASSTPCRPS